jgi:predicted amidophosphoribosyltransferase
VCSKCGNPLIEGAKFCLECGEKVVDTNMIICPECGKSVVKGKFCPECGHKFAPSECPNCGKPVVDGAKFCLECGQKL